MELHSGIARQKLVRRGSRVRSSRSPPSDPAQGMRARHEDLHPAFGKALPRCCEISMRFDRRGGRGASGLVAGHIGTGAGGNECGAPLMPSWQRYLHAAGLNNYPTGIGYNHQQHPHRPSRFSRVSMSPSPAGSPGVNAVNAANTTGPTAISAPITMTANDANHQQYSQSLWPLTNTGLRIQSSGDATITASGTKLMWPAPQATTRYGRSYWNGGAPHDGERNL